MTATDSPFLTFTRDAWGEFRQDTPMTLTEADLDQLHGQIESMSLQEVEEIYLPLSRLLNLYVAATQQLYQVTTDFLDHPEPKVPYIIGVSGSVAVGKSTTSRVLKALLSRWPDHRSVEIITTDGFLYPNAYLESHGLAERKGFPESYDTRRLIQLLSDLKAGKQQLQVPIYSHHSYDVIPNEYHQIDQPDIVIVEGLNVLQVGSNQSESKLRVYVSDYFDFSIYVHAETHVVRRWFLDRFIKFRHNAVNDVDSFFYQFAQMTEEAAIDFAKQVWELVNEKNLNENILPYMQRASLILEKELDHSVGCVQLRKI